MTATVTQQLHAARASLAPVAGELAAMEARLLAQHAWGATPEALVRDPHRMLAHQHIAALDALVARRRTHEPIAQILGRKHFWNDEFAVTRDVLTPRADSETIIAAALRLRPQARRILDLGTGSGCLLLSLLGEYPTARGTGIDASPAALAVARHNARQTGRGARCEWLDGDWCGPLAAPARFDLVVSNPPYIPTPGIAALMADVRDHEPHRALDGGADGLDCYRAILRGVPAHMEPGALLLFEVGMGQANDVAGLGVTQGLRHVQTVPDLHGIDRVVVLEHTQASEDL